MYSVCNDLTRYAIRSLPIGPISFTRGLQESKVVDMSACRMFQASVVGREFFKATQLRVAKRQALSSNALKPVRPSARQNCHTGPKHQHHGGRLASFHSSSKALAVTTAPSLTPDVYNPPTTGILSYLPKAWVPYAELIRFDKPAGTYYLFFPCLWSTLMAAPMALPMASPGAVVGYSLLFFSGALVMRGAGCTINDLLDRNLDPHVTRTKFRPIARGAITPFRGLVFTSAQLLTGLAILLQFPTQCLYYGIPSLAVVFTYPLFKRITYYPQFVLGLAFSWGAVMGFPALGVDLMSNSAALTAAACLYGSNVAWAVLYDIIYAHMDVKDDVKAGIKSMAVKHDGAAKQILAGLTVVQVGLLGAAGVASGAGPAFFVGSCGGALVTLGVMIKKVNLKSVKDCWWWFVNGCWLTGGAVGLGLAADYVARYLGSRVDEKTAE